MAINWQGSATVNESTLHQLSPYIGKLKSSMAEALISLFAPKAKIIYDPYCGSGTVALQAWSMGRTVVANDLSPYAVTLTRAKLFPYLSYEDAILEMEIVAKRVQCILPNVDLRRVPKWVRSFYHQETLREIIAWVEVLRSRNSYFLLSCLLGILHHQRPGFLSYPCSHTVPYLREKNFPRDRFPELYEYRSLRDRLEKKVRRALKRVPLLDLDLSRRCYMRSAAKFVPENRVGAIITSPPYMSQLTYARDNRLRLWFLGREDWRALDKSISPSEKKFFQLLKVCLELWTEILLPGGVCILVLGDRHSRLYDMSLPDAVIRLATKDIGGYSLMWKHAELIPNERRVRRGCRGSLTETVLVFQNKNRS